MASILGALVLQLVGCSSDDADNGNTGGSNGAGATPGSGGASGGSSGSGAANGGSGAAGAANGGSGAAGSVGAGGTTGGSAGAAGGAAGGASAGAAGATGGAGGTGGAAGGAAGSAGTAGTAGAGTSGAGGTAACTAPTTPVTGQIGTLEGTATRPKLTTALAANYTVAKYFEKAGPVTTPVADNWDPTAGVGDVATFTATYRVVKAGGGTHTTVQAAITAAVAAGGAARVYISVAPETYREVVCVPSSAPPITLYGTSADATTTTIVFGNANGTVKDGAASANPCNPSIGATTYGTSGSATFAAYSKDFQAKNLTFSNDADESKAGTGTQAVALSTQGDKQIYENVRLLGNQDTFYFKSSSVETLARIYVKSSYIEGDVDFICGRGVLVVDDSEIHFISTRVNKGYLFVPSTDSRSPYGILVNKSRLTADAGAAAGSVYLGRAWDESQGDAATYASNIACGKVYPNGQALVRESTLGAHVRTDAPWDVAATTKRPYSSADSADKKVPANRLWEFDNK